MSIMSLGFETIRNQLRFVEGSVLDRDLVQELVDGADLVFHLAAAVGVKLIMEQPSRSIQTTVPGYGASDRHSGAA